VRTPPSDPLSVPPPAGRGRALLPRERVDRVVDSRPEACGGCGLALAEEDPRPGRHQVAELPRARAAFHTHMPNATAMTMLEAVLWPPPAGRPCSAA